MPYSPINAQLFFAAYAGALAGMAASERVPLNSAISQAGVATIAGAYAQSFDTQWNSSTTLDALQVRTIEQLSQATWQTRAPQPGQVTTLQPSNYTTLVNALITIVNAGEAYTTSQGITPPKMGGVDVSDDGVELGFASNINFTGAGVTASIVGANVTVNIPGAGAITLLGDVTGLATATVVERINGATVPVSGALTVGNVLQVTGAAALSYGPVNLGGGANFVTGSLPAANQASQTMAGDVTGTTAVNAVATITGSANVVTINNGTAIVHGTNPATTGNVRVKNNYTWNGRNAANSADETLFDWSSAGTNVLTLNASGGIVLGAQTSLNANALVFTTGTVRMGINVATTGNFRVQHAWNMIGRNSTNASDVTFLDWGTTANSVTLGSSTTTGTNVTAAGTGTIVLSCGAQWRVDNTLGLCSNANNAASALFGWHSGLTTAPTIRHVAASGSVAGLSMTITAQGGGATGNQNGGPLQLRGGPATGTGLKGGVRLDLNGTTETMCEIVEIASGRRVTALNVGANLTATEMPANSGDKVTFVGNAATVPTADPANGFILYATGGSFGVRTTGGRIETAFATAATASAGAGALPATPEAFLVVTVGGNARKIPLYLT